MAGSHDRRASAEDNWHERTGVATGDRPGRFESVGAGPVKSAPSLRDACPVELGDAWPARAAKAS